MLLNLFHQNNFSSIMLSTDPRFPNQIQNRYSGTPSEVQSISQSSVLPLCPLMCDMYDTGRSVRFTKKFLQGMTERSFYTTLDNVDNVRLRMFEQPFGSDVICISLSISTLWADSNLQFANLQITSYLRFLSCSLPDAQIGWTSRVIHHRCSPTASNRYVQLSS